MRKLSQLLFFTLLMGQGLFGFAFAGEQKVAKAIITRGNVKAHLPDGSTIKVKKGTWLDEGTKVVTAPKSFVKFLFTDKSQMNLGPNSELEIAKFDGKKAGIINLMKGSLRSKVTKNYLEKEKQAKSKLFIKTKSAAMGVRGTDFMVHFDPRNQFTNLDVISGAVAMAPIIDDGMAKSLDRSALEGLVSSKSAVLVKKGQFTNAFKGQKKAAKPRPIPKEKLKSLQKNVIPMSTSVNPFRMGDKELKGGSFAKHIKNPDEKPLIRKPGSEHGQPSGPEKPRPMVCLTCAPPPPPPPSDCPDCFQPPPCLECDLPPPPPELIFNNRTKVRLNINQAD